MLLGYDLGVMTPLEGSPAPNVLGRRCSLRVVQVMRSSVLVITGDGHHPMAQVLVETHSDSVDNLEAFLGMVSPFGKPKGEFSILSISTSIQCVPVISSMYECCLFEKRGEAHLGFVCLQSWSNPSSWAKINRNESYTDQQMLQRVVSKRFLNQHDFNL